MLVAGSTAQEERREIGRNEGMLLPAGAYYPRDRLHEVLPRADAVVLATATDTSTIRMIGATELSLMKPSAVLLNIGRGELIDEPALIEAMRNRQISAAALDVTVVVPIPPDSPLWELDNIIISPHVSGTGKDGYARFKEIFHENYRRFREGKPLQYVVDWETQADDDVKSRPSIKAASTG